MTIAAATARSSLRRHAVVQLQLARQDHLRLLPARRALSSLTKAAATAPPDYPVEKRWTAVPPANAVHLSIGAVYVYSMLSARLLLQK